MELIKGGKEPQIKVETKIVSVEGLIAMYKQVEIENAKLRAEVVESRDFGTSVGADLIVATKRVREMEFQVGELQKALDRDKTGLAAALAAIREEVKGRRWICEGRGSYTYDDDRYRLETGHALDAIEKLAAEALTASGKLAYEALVEKRIDEPVFLKCSGHHEPGGCPLHEGK